MRTVEKPMSTVNDPNSFRVLIVDDEIPICKLLRDFLEKLAVAVDTAINGAEAMRLVYPGSHDLILLDLMMPVQDGLATLREVRRLDVEVPVLVMTGYGTIERAVEAMKSGANEFLLKPLSLEELKGMVVSERERRRLDSAVSIERSTVGTDRLLTCDIEMVKVLRVAKRIAPLNSTVLIQGESGTGKELVARSVHAESGNDAARFVAINCGAIPDQLLESELFGHERGAFTGAHARKIGFFEAADGGTIFLDEISEMSMELQVKLLRVLQERTFRRLGGTKEIPTTARIVASTNRDLHQEASAGRFRQDLYYRINVIKLQIPSLRERPYDVKLLGHHFLFRFARQFGKEVTEIDDDAMEILQSHAWPGNVRELQNVIERATAVTESKRITVSDLPDEVRTSVDGGQRHANLETLERAKERFESEYLSRIMERAKGNVSLAARLTNISRTNLYEKLKKYGLEVEGFRPA